MSDIDFTRGKFFLFIFCCVLFYFLLFVKITTKFLESHQMHLQVKSRVLIEKQVSQKATPICAFSLIFL